MKHRRLFLTVLILILTAAILAIAGLPRLQYTQDVRNAYFTKVKYPAITFQGTDEILAFYVYNRNLTTNGDAYGSFFLKFYVDGEFWWDEYSSSAYKTWTCGKGNSTIRAYSIPSWEVMRPVVHELKLELYWYDGNEAHLEDITSINVKVAVHVGPDDLLFHSYLILYLIGVVGIGLYILTFGRTRIRPPPQNPNSNYDQPLASAMMVSSKIHRYSFLWFFVVVFVSWQLVNALFYTFPIEQFRPILFTLQIAYSALLVLIIKKENSSLANYGYWWPKETNRFVLVCLWLAIFYISVMVFVPIAFARYNIFPQPSSVEALSAIFLALVASFASETIFRGYIQSKLTKMIGFPCALIATSVMFAANATLLWPFTLNSFFYTFLSLLVLGVFLGALFYRTKTLLCPIIFYGAVLAFGSLTPVEVVISANAKLFLHFAAIALSLLMLGVLTAKEVTRRRLGQMGLSER